MKRIVDEIVDLGYECRYSPCRNLHPRGVHDQGRCAFTSALSALRTDDRLCSSRNQDSTIGKNDIYLRGPSYFCCRCIFPQRASVRSSREGLPYLSLGLLLNYNVLQNLLRDLPDDLVQGSSRKYTACEADLEFMEAWLRMLRLLKTPKDIPALAPAYEREILYRVLMGPQGWYLRQLGLRKSNLTKIRTDRPVASNTLHATH